MKAISLLLLLGMSCLAASLHGQTVSLNRVENGGVSVQVPQEWASQATRDPIVLMLVDMPNSSSLVVVREAKRVVGNKTLQAYFDVNLAKIGGSWEAPTLSETQTMTEGGQKLWRDGTVTIVDPRGNKMPARVLLAAAEGKEFYYLMLMTERGASASGDGTLARLILESLRVR